MVPGLNGWLWVPVSAEHVVLPSNRASPLVSLPSWWRPRRRAALAQKVSSTVSAVGVMCSLAVRLACGGFWGSSLTWTTCAALGDGHAHVVRQIVVLLGVLTSYWMAIVLCDPSSSIVSTAHDILLDLVALLLGSSVLLPAWNVFCSPFFLMLPRTLVHAWE